MGEAVDLSLSKLTRSDLEAIATYVRSVKPIFSEALPKPAGAAADSPKIASLDNERGKRVFEGNCESCHAWTGAGAIVQAAQLTGDRAINDATATNVIQVILNGSGSADGGRPYMPSFADAYSDAEIAAVANYVTARFGSKPSQATPAEVTRLRAQR
jgi:mono/diheme cytochrome c family protein